MNDSMFDLLLVMMYIGCGGYCVYSYFVQKKSSALLANKFLCPTNGDPKQCKQPEAFVAYMLPRVLTLGIVLVIFGCIYLFNLYVYKGGIAATIILMTTPMVFLIWYAVVQRKAVKLYWEASKS